MSSFRPDTTNAVPEFVGQSFAGFSGFEPLLSDAERASSRSAKDSPGPGENLASDAPGDEQPIEFTRSQVEELEQAAFERGVNAGTVDSQRLDVAGALLESVAGEFVKAVPAVFEQSKTSIIDLALAISRHWIGREFEADVELVSAAIDRAIDATRDRHAERISLSPSDHEKIYAEMPERVERWRAAGTLDIEVDAELSSGEFRIDAQATTVDARFEIALHALRERLLSEGSAETLEVDS